jgi:hypothetical protein
MNVGRAPSPAAFDLESLSRPWSCRTSEDARAHNQIGVLNHIGVDPFNRRPEIARMREGHDFSRASMSQINAASAAEVCSSRFEGVENAYRTG